MKMIQYDSCARVNHGTQNNPKIEEVLSRVTMCWSEENEKIAQREAWGGEYTVVDDGQEEMAVPTQEQRIAQLEEALDMLLSGVTE